MDKNWAREEAYLILNNIITKDAYSNIEIRKRLNNSNLEKLDKALVTEIVNGTLRNLIYIDWIIKKFSNIKLEKMDSSIKNILRCGIYQIMFLDKIPDSAVCNESVELAKKYSSFGSSKFVNGLLRSVVRSKEKIGYPDKSDLSQFLSVRYSHPKWLVEIWLRDYGVEFAEELMIGNNQVPPFIIRLNRLKTTKEELLQHLKASGITYREGLYNEEAINIRGTSSIENLEIFKKGYFSVQDESSMLVGKIMNPKPGWRIIDVCSAPGGKAAHMAELMNNEGFIVCRDIHEHKLELINKNSNRLGINIIETQLFDAKDIDESYLCKADGVLVDAPCSGLGLLRRKTDIRWKKKPADLHELPKLQYRILENASKYLKKGGVLLYSTCTLNKKENMDIVRNFLASNSDFYLDNIKSLIPQNLYAPNAEEGFLELYPNVHNTDGFFIARIKKR
ncbi:16S rRNA (cytosine(967)-C(5))-methyltransferase RsmB [Lutispora thermophila]|uniref:16S rRNA (cytosine(967)-C(5))-methyltransferase n=1 Tax=Lutispora thermophila DSM 19022 TaxID=1122184 RepID=A0A1M6G342_9FIRM|nr:16S rRNA (cytosine(967)-C(5))-methyltransferase RsmB [Lutispora thermophila]SHJ04415.1 NusB antitermination factor [Lutispora thermophila DSM 19022]